jgi:ribosomal protein S18 acetylase RimI-like enzyme
MILEPTTSPIFTIRKACVEDAHILAEAEREIARTPGFLASHPDELKDENFTAKIKALSTAENGRYLVAEQNGEITGHAMFDPLLLAAIRHVVQLTLAVHPGWQGKGVGKALLFELIQWGRKAPLVEKAELHVRSGNTVAQTLYRKMGFVEEGRLKRRVKLGPEHYLDDVLMGLWLKG